MRLFLNGRNRNYLYLASLLILMAAVGCETSGIKKLKSSGVYTIAALADPGLDLPYSAYHPQDTFGTTETPAAVIVGYGYGKFKNPQLVSLDVVELSTGRSIFKKDYNTVLGKAVVQPLPIRKGGKYRVRLIVNGSEQDAYDFTINIAEAPTTGTSTDTRGRGGLSFSVQSEGKLIFALYDQEFYRILSYRVRKQASETTPNPLVQRAPGATTFHCRMDAQGKITESIVVQNTLGDECAQVFLKVLSTGSFWPWPADVREKFGSNTRPFTITFKLNQATVL